jgi:hypothetical protein
MKTRTHVKAGLIVANHNETLAIRSALKAGGWTANHNAALVVRSTPRLVDAS